MRRIVLLAGIAVIAFTGCESLRRIGLSVERPTATVRSVSLTEITFSNAELTTVLAVNNPNAIGITLSGLSYSLEIEGVEFLSGDQDRGIAIAAFDESEVELPLAIGYQNLFDTVSAVRDLSEAAYVLTVELRFDVPILGVVSVPLRREGTLPVLRLPRVRVADLVLESISISGARLELFLEIDNPNSFSFALASFDYAFSVQDRVWADGSAGRARTVPANGSERITASFSLSFAAFGRTVRDLLLGDDEIRYSFSSTAVIDPDLELVPTVTLPVLREGEIPLRRR